MTQLTSSMIQHYVVSSPESSGLGTNGEGSLLVTFSRAAEVKKHFKQESYMQKGPFYLYKVTIIISLGI